MNDIDDSNKHPNKLTKNKSMKNKPATSKNDVTSALINEATQIMTIFESILVISKNMIEVRVRIWISLGTYLNIHKKNVKETGINWERWAIKHFRGIGATRRRQCMFLARSGNFIEHFYFFGFERLYYFSRIMTEAKLANDREIGKIIKRFNLKARKDGSNITEDEFKIKIDKIREYFKFKYTLKGVTYDKEFILDVIDSGASFSKADYEAMINLQSDPDKQSEYLLEMLLNAGSPKGSKTTGDSKDSTLVLMAKFIENIDSYKTTGQIPAHYTKKIVRQFFDAATWFYNNVSN